MSAAAGTLIIPIYDLFHYYFFPLSPSTTSPSRISTNPSDSTALSVSSPTPLYPIQIPLSHLLILSASSSQMPLMPGILSGMLLMSSYARLELSSAGDPFRDNQLLPV